MMTGFGAILRGRLAAGGGPSPQGSMVESNGMRWRRGRISDDVPRWSASPVILAPLVFAFHHQAQDSFGERSVPRRELITIAVQRVR